ncbi:hypothetical protein [Streptomyces sp. NPDC002599]|uniref:hypothetical protein n=1 Tax=Streptomyces sp. NPDC002599 TaxID=3154421 RepID=UPI00332A36AB
MSQLRVRQGGFFDLPVGGFGPVEILPSVRSIGYFRFRAIGPDRSPELYRSALAMAWFQHTTDVPSEDRAEPGLPRTPWDEPARDFELQVSAAATAPG